MPGVVHKKAFVPVVGSKRASPQEGQTPNKVPAVTPVLTPTANTAARTTAGTPVYVATAVTPADDEVYCCCQGASNEPRCSLPFPPDMSFHVCATSGRKVFNGFCLYGTESDDDPSTLSCLRCATAVAAAAAADASGVVEEGSEMEQNDENNQEGQDASWLFKLQSQASKLND